MNHNSQAAQTDIDEETNSVRARSYQAMAKSCLFRGLSVFLAFCILTFLIIQLPITDTNKLLFMLALISAGLLAIWLTTPRTATPVFEDELAESEDLEATEIIEQPEDSIDESLPLSTDYFEQLVQEALNEIPREFEPYLANLAVIVEDEPDAELRKQMGLKANQTLFGLYNGNPLTSLGHSNSLLPERITIYQKPIETYSHGNPNRIRKQVRATVLHEIAHHFGIDHDEMPRWLK
ncbi:hypothetical protein KDA_28840 [Dictyobacter alpinus]|uniref:Metallopeptidase family protein n=1 Tax=Dictyobacter alpinus TaxID=2014873 RepID=A0A402B7X7_9CHLR|nr:metallopeptidase family protein [Dictyobacter alpinus]GCE27400.1 hypothetical protein KDA_28840 [Dictyobacter alpinus]